MCHLKIISAAASILICSLGSSPGFAQGETARRTVQDPSLHSGSEKNEQKYWQEKHKERSEKDAELIKHRSAKRGKTQKKSSPESNAP